MYLQKIMSVVRGRFYRIYYKICNKRIVVGKNVRIGRNVFLSARSNSKVVIGNNVIIGSNSDISALNGGIILIGDNVAIGSSNKIICHNSISIGNGTLFAPNVYIYDHNHLFDTDGVKRNSYDTGSIEIGSNCWICINSVVLKNTIIGDNCVVAAGAIINGNYGRCLKIVQKRLTEEITI